MKLEWLGTYRELMEKIIKYANIYTRTYTNKRYYNTKISLSAVEIQTLEYVLENEEKHQKMAELAQRLGVSPSAFSRNVKEMINKGLLEKYHSEGNKKDIIIQPSQFGREVYSDYSRFVQQDFLEKMIQQLDDIPEEHIEKFARTLDILADDLIKHPDAKTERLVKIE